MGEAQQQKEQEEEYQQLEAPIKALYKKFKQTIEYKQLAMDRLARGKYEYIKLFGLGTYSLD